MTSPFRWPHRGEDLPPQSCSRESPQREAEEEEGGGGGMLDPDP